MLNNRDHDKWWSVQRINNEEEVENELLGWIHNRKISEAFDINKHNQDNKRTMVTTVLNCLSLISSIEFIF